MAVIAKSEAAEVGRDSRVAFSLLTWTKVGGGVHVGGVAVVGEGREGGHEVLSVDCRSRAAEEVTEGACVRS